MISEMQTINFGGLSVEKGNSLLSLCLNFKNLNHPFYSLSKISHLGVPTSLSSSSPTISGLCRASQVFEIFPTSPEIFVRDARIEDCWEVAETHCSSFFPEYSFPLDVVLRIDRLIGMLFGFSIPKGCKRTCMVAVAGSSGVDSFFMGNDNFKAGIFNGKHSQSKGCVIGILTVDTVADFLPRKGPLLQRRKGIAYISNVAVRESYRRQGIAKLLIAKAEAKARNWGCHAIALHCDLQNLGAKSLYASLGFKCIKVPENATWPQPKTSPDMQFNFMMKLI